MPDRAATLAALLARLTSPSLLLLVILVVLSPVPLPAQGQGNGNGNGSGGGITPMAEGNGITVFTAPTVLPTKLPSTGPFIASFTVFNSKPNSIAVYFYCNAVGPVSCGGVTPLAASVPGNGSRTVRVTYSTTAASGEAQVQLIAELDVGTPPTSTGAVHFGVYGPGKGVPFPVAQSREHLDRGSCFTTGAGAAAGLACGDLFVVEGMPSVQTLGRDRSPLLYYNSATATGLTLVPVWYYEPATIFMPSSARVVLAVGNAKDSVTFTPPASDCNYAQCADSFQVVVGRNLDWSSLPTGYHQATVTLRNLYSGATHDSTVTVPLLVVNRSASEYGKGWSLLGVEQLLSDPADTLRKVWVVGDGSARVFRRGISLTSTMLSASGVTGFNATQAVNGSTTTAAWTSVALNGWIKVDLATPRAITTLGLHTLTGTGASAYHVQYSDNGTSWTTAFANFRPVGSGWRRVVWGDAGAHRYWRLLAAAAGGPTISELSFGGSGTWYGAPGAAPDSLVAFDSLGTNWYRRDLKHGAFVTFDATGRHRATSNRAGQRTRLVWTSVAGQVRLDSLVPPPQGTRGYKFHWNASTALLEDITDPTGRVLRTEMSSGRLEKLVAPGELDSTRYAYDSRGVLTTRSVSRQHLSVTGDSALTKYTYANNGRVTKVEIQADSQQTLFETITLTPWDERGITAPVVVDTAGVPTRVDGPLAGTADALDVLVDRFGGPRRMTHVGLGTVTRLWHDSTQTLPALVTRVQLPHPTTPGAAGRIVTLSWNTRGNLMTQRDSSWHLGDIKLPTKAASYAYLDTAHPDAVTKVMDALGRDVDYTYDSLGLTATTTDARGHQTTFQHLAAGSLKGLVWRVTEENVTTWRNGATSVLPLHRSFIYDSLGNLRTDSLPHGVRTLYERDARGEVSAVWNFGGIKRSFLRDALGRVLQDQQSTVKQPIPGGLNLLTGCDSLTTICVDSARVDSTLPATLTTTYVHSPSGITSVTDPRGVGRSYQYGPRGEVRAETDDYGHRAVATTNTAGQLASVLTRMNKIISYSYDAYGRRSGLVFPDVTYDNLTAYGGTVTYTYDLLARVTQASGDDADVKQEYFADGALKATVTANGSVYDSLSYTYDATGARTTMAVKDEDGVTDSTLYAYDDAGALDSMVVKWGNVATPRVFHFEWDALGRREQVRYPLNLNRTDANFRYDATGRLRAMWVADAPEPGGGTNSLLAVGDTVLAVDPSGRILRERMRCAAGGQPNNSCGEDGWAETEIRYNQLGWMVSQVRGATDFDTLRYDASGNITWRKVGLQSPKIFYMDPGHNQLDSMTQAGNRRRDYLFDPSGSRAQDIIDSLAFVDRAYFYDALGRTSGFFVSRGFNLAGEPQVFEDANGCRHDALGRQIKACAGSAPYINLDGASVIRAQHWRIRHGPRLDDPLVSLARDASVAFKELYHITDGSGRHYARSEAHGTIDTMIPRTEGYLGWDATGVTEDAHGYAADRMGQPSAPGLSFFRNRVYDQATGRWTQEDPIGVAGGINLYQFNGNDPASYRDPYGLCPDEAKDGTICIDFFIKKNRTLGGFKGDGRGPDPNAPPEDSRVQIVIDPKDLRASYFTVSESCSVGCNPPSSRNSVVIGKDASGTIGVSFSLVSSLIPNGPDIDGSVAIFADGSSRGDVSAFPSNSMYRRVDGAWVQMKPDHEETSEFDLFNNGRRNRW